MLEPLGVDDATFAVYHALLSHPDSTPEQIAALVKRPMAEVLETMGQLRKLDLLVPTWADPEAEHAVHPRVGLTVLAERRRGELNRMLGELKQAESSADVIAEQYNELLTARSSGDVEVLKGRANASRRIEELGLKAKESFWGMIPAHIDDTIHPIEYSPDMPLLERGLKMRTIYLQSMTVSKPGLDYAATLHRLGGEVRATPTLPMRLLILDQEIAIMAMDPENPTAGAVIHRSPGVMAVALALFDAYWARASEMFSPEDRDNNSPLTPHEAEVLRLLAGGAKDEQVARLLGISLRTARRITANLSERLDATSRFELGVAAAKRGWV
ncbi:helix-turn-helix transcriptional regulator [Kribbella catacumbae]|uniref:helix-turn-helix transcriptional regulator n=1 Tax=Kribbella catacumbae TaxID=460086 RepID=UPI0003A7C155|nr:LuxR C-terminal-related transcriptional regulator [Kribbella catacumbae]